MLLVIDVKRNSFETLKSSLKCYVYIFKLLSYVLTFKQSTFHSCIFQTNHKIKLKKNLRTFFFSLNFYIVIRLNYFIFKQTCLN